MSAAIGISYPAAPSFQAFELKQCENCPDLFTRRINSGIKYCGHCIADRLQHPVPWAKGSLAAYMSNEAEPDQRHPQRKPTQASKACRTAHHSLCLIVNCPCPCHPHA